MKGYNKVAKIFTLMFLFMVFAIGYNEINITGKLIGHYELTDNLNVSSKITIGNQTLLPLDTIIKFEFNNQTKIIELSELNITQGYGEYYYEERLSDSGSGFGFEGTREDIVDIYFEYVLDNETIIGNVNKNTAHEINSSINITRVWQGNEMLDESILIIDNSTISTNYSKISYGFGAGYYTDETATFELNEIFDKPEVDGIYDIKIILEYNDTIIKQYSENVTVEHIEYYSDNDFDGFLNNTDCDDNNANINPNATEILYNGLDDDCNSSTLDYIDDDKDGYDNNTDCDDNNSEVHPNRAEILFNGIDDDCNANTLDNPYNYTKIIEAEDIIDDSGKWIKVEDSFYSNGFAVVSSTNRTKLSFDFTAENIFLLTEKRFDYGILEIKLDNSTNLIDLYDPYISENEIIEIAANLDNNTHHLEFTVTGNKNPLSQGYYCLVDSFVSREYVELNYTLNKTINQTLNVTINETVNETILSSEEKVYPNYVNYDTYNSYLSNYTNNFCAAINRYTQGDFSAKLEFDAVSDAELCLYATLWKNEEVTNYVSNGNDTIEFTVHKGWNCVDVSSLMDSEKVTLELTGQDIAGEKGPFACYKGMSNLDYRPYLRRNE